MPFLNDKKMDYKIEAINPIPKVMLQSEYTEKYYPEMKLSKRRLVFVKKNFENKRESH